MYSVLVRLNGVVGTGEESAFAKGAMFSLFQSPSIPVRDTWTRFGLGVESGVGSSETTFESVDDGG